MQPEISPLVIAAAGHRDDRQRSFSIWAVLSTQAPTLCQRLKDGFDSHGHADPSPGGRLFKAPALRAGNRRPLFRRRLRGLLCGAGVEPPRGRGRPSGARESQLFFGCYSNKYNKNVFKDPFEHHHHYYYRGAIYNKDLSCQVVVVIFLVGVLYYHTRYLAFDLPTLINSR